MPPTRTSRLALGWAGIRDSLWFVPSLAVLVGSTLAFLMVQIPTPATESRFAWVWLFGGGAEGARGVLSAIAGSLITVTGVVFSVTIVALQLASSQFTPRILRTFVADRVNQIVLGIFIGTFTYTLLVLRTIHSTGGGSELFVPQVGVILALVLLLVSIGALVVFINHAARSVQASVILHREAEQTLARIDVLFPERVGRPARDAAAHDERAEDDGWSMPAESAAGRPTVVEAAESGYLQSVDADALWELGAGSSGEAPLMIRMELHIGAFAFPGKPLACVWPAERSGDAIVRAVRDAFVLGPERTPEQDVEYGIIALSDIAVRALSPGINDPTTAMHCIDRLGEVLAALGSRSHPARVRASSDGAVRLLVRDTPFERAAGLAFDQIRYFGADNPAISKRLLETFTDLARVTHGQARRALVGQVEAVMRAVRRDVTDPADLAAIERLAGQALEAAGATRQEA